MTSVPYYVPIGCRSDIVRLLGANGDDVKDRAVFEVQGQLGDGFSETSGH